MIIDAHGHYTTADKPIYDSHATLVTAQKSGVPGAFEAAALAMPDMTDDGIRASLESNQLRLQRERGTDVTLFSPRASTMNHQLGDEVVSKKWSGKMNDLIARAVSLYPNNFIGGCQLPQSTGVPAGNSVKELERCVNELGMVGCNINPDPSGGHWQTHPLTSEAWYDLYEAMEALNVGGMIHVTQCAGDLSPLFHFTGAHYLNADTEAGEAIIKGYEALNKRFPNLKLVIPHGGGALPYHWGRYRGLAAENKWGNPKEIMGKNMFFDSCVYHLPGIELLTKVIPADGILFSSEMVGAVKSKDPDTGEYFDDTKKYFDQLSLSPLDRAKIDWGNAVTVYPRMLNNPHIGPALRQLLQAFPEIKERVRTLNPKFQLINFNAPGANVSFDNTPA